MSQIESTNFQKAVWEQLRKIPVGQTRTYKEIAIAIGKPNAHRAVANACGKNPLPIIRPCHRVICSNGNIGGYSFGAGTILKKALLSLESNS